MFLKYFLQKNFNTFYTKYFYLPYLCTYLLLSLSNISMHGLLIILRTFLSCMRLANFLQLCSKLSFHVIQRLNWRLFVSYRVFFLFAIFGQFLDDFHSSYLAAIWVRYLDGSLRAILVQLPLKSLTWW